MTIGSILGMIFIFGLVVIAIRKLSKMDSEIVNQFRRDGYAPGRRDYESDSKGSDE